MKRLRSVLLPAVFLTLVTGSLPFFLIPDQAAAADAKINKVDTVFRTAWVYESLGDNFTNSQVTGRKWWGTSIFNSPDDTKAPITSLSLRLESNQVFGNLNTKSLVTKGPPSYEWSFGDIPEGTGTDTWVDSRQPSGLDSTPITFTPGFDASRSMDKTKFSTSDIQTLTITVTPWEPIQGISIYVGTMKNENVDSVIISPTSNDSTKLSSDGQSLNVNLTGLNSNVTYTTIVTIEVAPKASEVTFMPQVDVKESEKQIASGSASGDSISHRAGEPEDKVGTWIWRTQDNCLWQWREVVSRWVSFKGISDGPQGQGTGKAGEGAGKYYILPPQPAFNWRFDIGLAIGLLAISPGLYLAGRRFRRQKRSLNLTWVVYPLIISLTGWYVFTFIYNMVYVPNLIQGPEVLVHIAMSTIPLAFSYAAIKKVKLEFKWTALSVAGMVLATYFLVVAIAEFFNPVIPKYNLFFTGIWDHTFFPLSFGLLMLCDLNKMPKMFWFILFPMAVGNIGGVRVISGELIWGIPAANPNAPSLMFYFGVKNLTQILALPQDKLMFSLILFLREALGFILLVPALFCYYFFKNLGKSISGFMRKRRQKSPSV